MREAAGEVMLDHPQCGVSEPVGQHALRQQVLERLLLDLRRASAHLQLVPYADAQRTHPFLPGLRKIQANQALAW